MVSVFNEKRNDRLKQGKCDSGHVTTLALAILQEETYNNKDHRRRVI